MYARSQSIHRTADRHDGVPGLQQISRNPCTAWGTGNTVYIYSRVQYPDPRHMPRDAASGKKQVFGSVRSTPTSITKINHHHPSNRRLLQQLPERTDTSFG